MGRMTLRDVMLAYEREYVETPTRRESARRHMRSHLAILRDIAIAGYRRNGCSTCRQTDGRSDGCRC